MGVQSVILVVHHMANALLDCLCRHTYLQSLPRRAYIPIFWTEEEAQLLQVGHAVTRMASSYVISPMHSTHHCLLVVLNLR